jgi:hypothetical protein
MADQIPERVRKAAIRAAAWLKDNPDRHIRGDLAVTSKGRPCTPLHHDAQCFCALGRFGKELGTNSPYDEFGSFGLSATQVWQPNDSGAVDENREMACPKVKPGAPEGYQALLRLFNPE